MKCLIGTICILGFCLSTAIGDDVVPAPGPTASGDDRPAVECGGISSKGERIVYVIDHRGTMQDSLDFMRAGLKRSLDGLNVAQSFAVVVFAEEAKVLGPAKLQQASEEVKLDVTQQMDKLRPEGMQDDMLPPYQPALEKAFALKPDVIYFLTDDGMIDPKTLDVVKALNKDHKVCINVVAASAGQADAQSAVQFQKLANDNGGLCKLVSVGKGGVVADGGAATTQPTIAQIAGMQVASTQVAATPAAVDAQIPTARFYGVEAKANRVVYVIDHSGSLLDNFDFLREEIKRSVGSLLPAQQFAVVTFAEGVDSDSPTALAWATTENKRALEKRIDDVKAQGQNDDMLPPFQQAFKRAFALKPQVIFFLTDGHFDPKVLDIVYELNKDHKVQINTFAFVQEEPDYKVQMQNMAKDNGGEYKFVAERDLGK